MRPKTKKGKSQEWYRKKCVGWAKLKAKERDNYICQKCGKKVEGANAHGSHIYNEGAHRVMAAEIENILCMCYYCHINWWHKSPVEAADWFKEKFPELAEKLRLRAQKIYPVNWELTWLGIKETL